MADENKLYHARQDIVNAILKFREEGWTWQNVREELEALVDSAEENE